MGSNEHPKPWMVGTIPEITDFIVYDKDGMPIVMMPNALLAQLVVEIVNDGKVSALLNKLEAERDVAKALIKQYSRLIDDYRQERDDAIEECERLKIEVSKEGVQTRLELNDQLVQMDLVAESLGLQIDNWTVEEIVDEIKKLQDKKISDTDPDELNTNVDNELPDSIINRRNLIPKDLK